MNEKNTFEFKIEGDNLLMHKFNGLAEEKDIKKRPKNEQAEKHAYRDDNNGMLYVPAEWIRGSLIGAFLSRAGNKEGKKTRFRVSPRIAANPPKMSLNTDKYVIDVRSVPSGGATMGVRDMCIRPMVKNWSVSGNIITTLDITEGDMKDMFEVAGEEVGIGSNRVNGFGRFMVTSFKKVAI